MPVIIETIEATVPGPSPEPGPEEQAPLPPLTKLVELIHAELRLQNERKERLRAD